MSTLYGRCLVLPYIRTDYFVSYREEESQARRSLERALKYRKLSLERLNDFCELRYRLEESGISLHSIEPFVKALEGAKKLGYDTDRMVRMLSSFDFSSLMQAELEKSISFQEMKLRELKDSCVLAETQLSIHNQTLTNYRHLEWMGFGIPQLISLYHTIQEVASANNIPDYEAVQKFLTDVDENYAAQRGYEGKLRALRSEKEKAVAELRYLRATLGSSIGIAAAMFLGELLTLGFTENEVLEVANTLKSKPKESTDKAPIDVGLNKAVEGSIQDKQLVNHDGDLPKLAGQMSFQPPSFFYPFEPSFMPHVTTPPVAPTLEVAYKLKSTKESTDKAPIHVGLNKAVEGSIQDKQLVNHDVDLPKLAGQMSFQPPSFFYPFEPSFMPPHVTTPPVAPTLL